MRTSPTQRSLKLLRDEGFLVSIVEKWNQYARIRQDLFGFADLLAIRPGVILAVQTTSADNAAARLAKIASAPEARVWLAAGGVIEVHGWRKGGARGKRKVWVCNRRVVTLQDLNTSESPTVVGNAMPREQEIPMQGNGWGGITPAIGV